MKHTALTRHWLNFVAELATTTDRKFVHHGMRRIVEDVLWHIPGQYWETGIPLKFSQLGYKNDSSKMKQLARNYFNEEAIQAANHKLKSRVNSGKAQTSVAVMMGAGQKSSKSMGFCMQSLVITHTKEGIRINMFYRSTEVVQKFLADLKFLHELILPKILEGIDQKLIICVRFNFVNAYVSALFFPLIYQFLDPTDFLKAIHKYDKVFWRRCAVSAAWMYRTGKVHSFRTRQNMFEFYRNLKGIDHAKLTDYLKKHDLFNKEIDKTIIEEEGDD